MQRIMALSYSDDLLSLDFTGEIHSIYDKTINILSNKKSLYVICKNDIYNAPRQIKLNNQDFGKLNLIRGSKVARIPDGICVGDVEILIKESPMFTLRQLKYPKKFSEHLDRVIKKIKIQLTNQLDTVGFFRKTCSNDIEHRINLSLKKYSSILLCGIASESYQKIDEGINHLIGLGSGLTPAGDDFLTGALLIINSNNFPFKEIQSYVNTCVKINCNKTNIISQNELHLAMNGKSMEPIILFIDALYKGEDFCVLELLVSKILQIGSSSGSDILAGILIILEAIVFKENQMKP